MLGERQGIADNGSIISGLIVVQFQYPPASADRRTRSVPGYPLALDK
jgi:hypothetical protein